jgi:hypothetical protein
MPFGIGYNYYKRLGTFALPLGPKVLPMKTKVICGRSPILGEGKRKTRVNFRNENGGVVVRPSRRRDSLVLAALRLIARRIRDKE